MIDGGDVSDELVKVGDGTGETAVGAGVAEGVNSIGPVVSDIPGWDVI